MSLIYAKVFGVKPVRRRKKAYYNKKGGLYIYSPDNFLSMLGINYHDKRLQIDIFGFTVVVLFHGNFIS